MKSHKQLLISLSGMNFVLRVNHERDYFAFYKLKTIKVVWISQRQRIFANKRPKIYTLHLHQFLLKTLGFALWSSGLSLSSSCRIRGEFLMSSSSSTPKTSHHLRVILSTSCRPSVTFQISPQLNFSFTSQLLSAPSISALPGCYLRRCYRRNSSSWEQLY